VESDLSRYIEFALMYFGHRTGARMQSKRRQRGFSTLGVFFYSALIFSGYALVAILVLGTLYFSRKQTWVAVVVALFWLWAWSYTSYWGNGPQKWAMKIAVAACKDEISRLPRKIAAESVMDEAAFLTAENVKNLLVLRKLKFVEIRVRRHNGYEHVRYLHPSEGDTFGITSTLQEGSVVRLDLGERADAACLKTPNSLALPPGMCIRMRPSSQPTAQYSVHHTFRDAPIPLAVGNWVLVDRLRNHEVARISTWDTPGHAQLGNPATIGEEGPLDDCRGAHALFFGNLYGSPHARPGK
jgi:hypothetical protein